MPSSIIDGLLVIVFDMFLSFFVDPGRENVSIVILCCFVCNASMFASCQEGPTHKSRTLSCSICF